MPLGVIGVIYEARPNVTIDAAALALKTGNSIILRGSSSAINSNKQLVSIVHKALNTTAVPADSILLLEESGHEIVNQMMRLNSHIDVLIPRGGESLIRNVVDNSSVPVIETGMGNCHVYIDKDADYDMAEKIVLNSKTQRPSVCNATETLLVQEDWAKDHLSQLIKALKGKQVAINGCPQTTALCNDRSIKNAGEEDWAKEYLNLEIAIKIVKDIDEAIAHIDMYSTRHTEAIITNNADHARKFQLQVDAASVNHNASTRFTDGSEFGFGAEIGISTQKLHGRGPLGLREITSYKYLVHGTGQIRE